MKRRELTGENMQILLDTYEGVLYSALKKLGMYRSHQNFDDYYQEGCLELFAAYELCEVDPLEHLNRYTFIHFLQRRLRWAFLDQKRKEGRLHGREDIPESELFLLESPSAPFEDTLEMKELLHGLTALLTEKEQLFLQDRLIRELSMTEIARRHGVSRNTVHYWRQRIQDKLASLLTK